MQFSLDAGAGRLHLRACEPGRVRINDEWFATPLLLTPSEQLPGILPASLEQFDAGHVAQLCAQEAEVILIGTGARQQRLPFECLKAAAQASKALDVMDTLAACRTFVVLASEGRKVIAALF